MTRERKACSIEPLGDIASGINPNEKERDSLLAGLLQCCQAMGCLLEARPELSSERLNIVM
jgi:hypothetical protein